MEQTQSEFPSTPEIPRLQGLLLPGRCKGQDKYQKPQVSFIKASLNEWSVLSFARMLADSAIKGQGA